MIARHWATVRMKGAGTNKREPSGILRCHKCAKYREGETRGVWNAEKGETCGDRDPERERRSHGLRFMFKIILLKH